MIDRPAEDVARKVDLADVLGGLREIAAIIRMAAAGEREAHPEMPLAETAGHIALLLEETRERESVPGDQRSRETPEHAVLQARAPVVTTGQQAVARRRADARRGMTVREAHAALGQGVEMRGQNLTLRVIGTEVAEALVVGQDDDDIGPIGGEGRQAYQPAA